MEIDLSTIEYIVERIGVINGEMGEIQISVAVLEYQMSQISFWFRTLVVAFVAFGISQIWQIYRMLKK